MKLSENVKEKLVALLTLGFDIFKCLSASLLVVFTPQNCPGDVNSSDTSLQVNHACSKKENFEELSILNEVTVIWNFICLGLLSNHYFIVWNREKFLIEKFNQDPKFPQDNLSIILQKEP